MTYRLSFRIARSAPQKQEPGYESTGSDSLLFQAHCVAPGIAADSGSLFRRPPLDGRIQNYDSPYHVLSTNVKTEVCSPSMRSVMRHGQCAILTSFSGSVGADCASGPARKIVIVDFVYRRRMSR